MKKISIILLIVTAIIFLSGCVSQSSSQQPISSKTTQTSELPVRELGNFYKLSNEPITSDNKVRIVFIGAEFCPFCATERWPIIESLSRFGTFNELKATTSASFNEPFLNLPTYYFVGVKYDSSHIQFDHKEFADRNFNKLEALTSEEQSLFNMYNPRGSIPFLLIGGKKGIFVQVGSGFSPGTIQGLTFSSIQNDLKNNANNKVTQSIITEANVITALICYNNDNKQINVCNDPEIANLISKIR